MAACGLKDVESYHQLNKNVTLTHSVLRTIDLAFEMLEITKK